MAEIFLLDTNVELAASVINLVSDQSPDFIEEARLLALINKSRSADESVPDLVSLAAGSIIVHSVRSIAG